MNYFINDIAYTLTRSKRKTVAIYIRNGFIEVRAPLKMPKKEIDKFILLKEKWITKKLASSVQQVNKQKHFTLDYSDIIICRNKPHTIIAQIGNDCWYDDGYFYIPPDLTPNEIKQACIGIYKTIAADILTEKTQKMAAKMSVNPESIKISNAKAQWGCCTSRKKISYSWRLIMADDDVIDYVIVHELAHIIEMNHSKRFLDIVESVIPDYKDRKARLRDLQSRLECENWTYNIP